MERPFGFWTHKDMAEVFWVGQKSDQFVAWHILDNYHFCSLIRHAFHCIFVLESALPSTCKKGSCMSQPPQDK